MKCLERDHTTNPNTQLNKSYSQNRAAGKREWWNATKENY